MIPHDAPTPPAPAEVCERLESKIELERIFERTATDSTDQEIAKDNIALFTAALLLIEQGEKERVRLDWIEKQRRRYTRPPFREVTGTQWVVVWEHEHGTKRTLREVIDLALDDAARAQPTPESK